MKKKILYFPWGFLLLLLCVSPFSLFSTAQGHLSAAPAVPRALAALPPQALVATGEAGKLRVYLEDLPIQFDVKPRLYEEKIMLPLRALGERAGFLVHWEKDRKRVTLHGPGREIALYPGNPLFAVNGILHRTAHPPLLHGGRILVGFDLLKQATGLLLHAGEGQGDVLRFRPGQPFPAEQKVREQPLYFVELLLPPGDRVKAHEKFEIRLAAPFVRGIFAYEISFFYNPGIIQVIDVYNPNFQPLREFYMKEIDNREGKMRYTLTTLGYREDLPPRQSLAVIEAVVSRAGAVPLIEGTFTLTLLDNRARIMPVGMEERVLSVGN